LELDVLLHQLLKTPIAFDGLLQLGHLFGRNIARDVPALFITLMVVIGAVRSLAYDTESPIVHALDLGDLLEKRFWGLFGVHHGGSICYTHIYHNKKRGKTLKKKNLVSRPSADTPI
jgi:hypothetical protein